MKTSFKKLSLVTGVLCFGMFTSMASAATINVNNANQASVTNNIGVTSSTGGNRSTGARGGVGGDGGSATSAGTSGGSVAAGGGGFGGDGGNGGTIITGNAVSTSEISNDVNSTETLIQDTCACDDRRYDEVLKTTSQVGSSQSQLHALEFANNDQSTFNTQNSQAQNSNSNNSSSLNNSAGASGNENSSSSNNSGNSNANYSSAFNEFENNSANNNTSNSNSAAANSSTNIALDQQSSGSQVDAAASENHNNQTVFYKRTYVGDNDVYNVNNTNTAALSNTGFVESKTGKNTSTGKRGANGGLGGSASTAGPGASSVAAGRGGDGGFGGNGGNIATGVSDSLSTVVNITGRTITRIIR